jgi:hypothetical protein
MNRKREMPEKYLYVILVLLFEYFDLKGRKYGRLEKIE